MGPPQSERADEGACVRSAAKQAPRPLASKPKACWSARGTASRMALIMMPALLPSKLPTASEVQRQVAAARQKSKSLPSILRSPPRASPQEAAAPRQQQRPVETRALLPRAAAPARSEFCGPDRALVLLREDALAPIATRVVFKPADPAQQKPMS